MGGTTILAVVAMMQSNAVRCVRSLLLAMALLGHPWQTALAKPTPLLCEPEGTTADRPDNIPMRSHGLDEPPDRLSDGISVSTLAAEGFLLEPIQELITDLREGTYSKVDSVLVARHGKLVFETYLNGFGRTTKHQTRSAFKSITSTLVGIAIDKGLIAGVDVPISAFSRNIGRRSPVTASSKTRSH